MKLWLKGAKIHPGWGWASLFCAMCGVAAEGKWFGWTIGAVWFVPVILTCRSVGKANP